MIDLHTWSTPNGHKVSIALEELGLPYRVHPVNIGAGDQFTPEFLQISPNNKIPAIVDNDGPNGSRLELFESGAILLYLAEKTGSLLSNEPLSRAHTIQWLMFQMGGLGPMLGQVHHFRHYAPEVIPYAIDRYTREAGRLYGVMDRHLGRHQYLADDYSIADIACFPWVRHIERQGLSFDDFPNLHRWFETIASRPAVQRGLLVPDTTSPPAEMSEEAKANLFGAQQYERR